MVRFHSPKVPQKGFAGILIIITVLIGVLVGAFSLVKNGFNPNSHPSPNQIGSTGKLVAKEAENPDEPPLKLKSIGVNFEDLKFTKQKLQFGVIFTDFGFVIPASPDRPSKRNPQPTFIVPLGTKVHSLVDGVVANMPTLWSGDISIQVTENGQMQKWVYETEHVRNPIVKVGDKVRAGQVIAEVSDFDKGNPGLGAVEMGILKGGNPPKHVCPFLYLDPSIKDEIFKKLLDFYKAWEEYRGDKTLYPETYSVPGCQTTDEIEG